MKSIFAAILAVAATVASAQSNIVSITSPLTGTVYTAGQPAIISWYVSYFLLCVRCDYSEKRSRVFCTYVMNSM